MKRIFALLFILLSPWAQAAPMTLKFDQVPVTQLLKATYRNVLGLSYGLDASVIANTRLVTLDVSDLPEERLAPTVDAVLRQAGVFKHVSADGVVFFSGSPNDFLSQGQGGGASNGQVMEQNFSALAAPSTAAVSGELPLPSVAYQAFAAEAPVAQIPENFTLYQPRNLAASVLQPIADQMLGTKYNGGDAVFLSGSAKNVEKVRFLMEQLDQSPAEIFAKALVVEFTSTESEGSTFEFALQALSGKLKIGLGSLLPRGENFIKFQDGDLSAILTAVSGDSRFHVVSAPTLRVRDGSTGRVLVGQEVPTLSSSSLDNQGNAQQSIQYRSAGVLFELKPAIMRNRIELELRQEISDYVKTQSSGIDSPTLTKRELTTVVNAQPGELIVLGGLDQTRDDSVERGFSFLPKSMRSSSMDKLKTQVLIVLQVQRVI